MLQLYIYAHEKILKKGLLTIIILGVSGSVLGVHDYKFTDQEIASIQLMYSLRCIVFPHRVKSRCVEDTFRRSKIGPRTAEERMERMSLEKGVAGRRFSHAVGWVVGLGEVLQQGAEEIDGILTEIQEFRAFHEEQRQSRVGLS